MINVEHFGIVAECRNYSNSIITRIIHLDSAGRYWLICKN